MHVTPFIFHIARTSLHDGAGIRTVVYFKGCNMHCRWCHNPKGLECKKELFFHQNKCIGCGICETICPHILRVGEIDRDACIACGNCAKNCPANALEVIGNQMSVEELYSVIAKDRAYYDRSGGGVTLSGGECLLYPEFVAALLKKCKENDIHTLIESAFHVPWEHIASVLPYTDMFYADVKHMDSDIHKKYTGVSNERILENITRLAGMTKQIVLRTPAIPGVNDDPENLSRTEQFAHSLGLEHEVLKYNNLAKSKYTALDKEYTEFS